MSTPASLHSDLGDRIETAVGSILPYLNKAVWLVAKRLYHHKSKLVAGELSVSVTASSSTGTLPSNYAGLFNDPYINGTQYPLKRLYDDSVRVFYSGVYSTPYFYEIVGTTIRLIPGSSSACTINGDYFAKPTTLTATTDTLPWTERLDDILAEYLVEATKLQPIPEAALQSIIVSGVDDYIKRMDKKAPSKLKRFRIRVR